MEEHLFRPHPALAAPEDDSLKKLTSCAARFLNALLTHL